ncbi:hypothetical protein SAMN05421505_101279 [Sinosporangium album]|uniref:Uncharacterized protein n=1 Tax=Sinosporangium album TaxID=504805 RepID=A0A1G7R6J8_9ACTN|nr:DUF5691 domain-containing protein [Sinosporangium album]SDG06426.1 hypothetical protein SAMN05421505_101279 [Sinosporangium album]
MTARTVWEDLLSAALIGTDRRPSPGADGEPAAALLSAAAAEEVRRRAGRRPRRGEPLPPAAPEERPLVPEAAITRLTAVLGGDRVRLLPEWLAAAAGRERRLPPYLLPALLDHGVRDRSIREHLGVLAGRRGRWLAGLNPAWAYLAEAPGGGDGGAGERMWEFGSRGDRVRHLRELRETDPGAARDLLASAWDRETPGDRAAFLDVLRSGLSPADEPFLEAALDDRRREVRHRAADLLTMLPGSRLARRMAARAARCLGRDGDGFAVNPPSACDPPMERDGIRAAAPGGSGRRGWWLQQVIARTPLGFWPGHLGLTAEEITAAELGDWSREVRVGWERAAVLQHDAAWARALFAREPLADLLAVLPAEERAVRAAEVVRGHAVDGQLIMLLGGVPGPWGPPLAKAVLNTIVETLAVQPWNVGELARMAAERVDPALAGLVADLSDDAVVQNVAETLRFRDEMLKELQ